MEKTDAYVVMTNNAINIVTTDPNVADQAKAQNPGSIVKRFPLTAKMQNGTGIVGEALEGDFDTGDQDQSIGQDDVEFVDGPPPADGDDDAAQQQSPDGEEQRDNVDVLCMDIPLAIRMFEYVLENNISDEELHELVEKMTDLGNASDDVLTMEHYDEITGGQATADTTGSQDDEFADSEFDDDEFSDSGEQPPADQQVNDELELGEDAYDANSTPSEIDPRDEELFNQFADGQITRDEYIERLQQVPDGYEELDRGNIENGRRRLRDPYGDDVTDEFPEDEFADELGEAIELGDDTLGQPAWYVVNRHSAVSAGPFESKREARAAAERSGRSGYAIEYGVEDEDGFFVDELHEDVNQQQGQPPAQPNPALDAAYMNGYNTGKRGAQAQQQNINQPAGVAYNRGFTDGKAGQPPLPPSKQKTESTSHPRHIAEKVETFASFLAAVEKASPVPPTVTKVSALFKAKKQKATEAETHFELVQDPKTTAVKITNSPMAIQQSTNTVA